MTVYCVIITIVALILLVLLIRLCLAVMSCEKQIRYIRREQTSMKLSRSFAFRPLDRIIDHFEQLRRESREMKRDQQRNLQQTKEMLAGISHDIRTPLTSISGYIEMLEHADAGEQQRYLHIITARLRDMEELLDTFFVYARLQASEEEIECRRQPIYPLLCESVLSYYAQLQEKGIAPQMICADEQVQGVVEEASLRRIFQNLIVNVIRYGADPFTIQLYPQDDRLLCIFSNACIESFDVHAIFQRFYKGDAARNTKGSGLGMAIVKELCEQMDIEVQAEKREEQLTITLRIPMSAHSRTTSSMEAL